jgi:hypothetical protein
VTFALSSSPTPLRGAMPWRRLVLGAAVLGALAACGPAELSSSPPALEQRHAQGAALQVSSEIPLSASPAHWSTYNPVVAAGGGLYLAVWQEFSSGSPPDLVGVRIRASDGAVLDDAPIHIAATQVDLEPAVAFDGTHFLVVWQDTSSIPTIRGARVRASDGAVLDASPPRYSPNTFQFPYQYPAVAFDGTNYLVVWFGYFEHGGTVVRGLQGIRVSPSDGLPIDPAPIVITTDSKAYYFKVASGGGYSLVTWTNGAVKGVRLNSAGQVLDAAPQVLTDSTAQAVRVASSGSRFLLAWVDDSNALRATLVRAQDGARLGPPDTLLDSEAIVSASMPNTLSVTFDGVDYQVLWPAMHGGAVTLRNTRVSAEGVPGPVVALSAYHGSTAPDWVGVAASAPGRLLAVYSQYVPALGKNRPMARLVNQTQPSLSPILPVGPQAFTQKEPVAAAGNGVYLVAWSESHPSTPYDTHIFAVRVDATSGAVLDSTPLLVSQTAGLMGSRAQPAVSFAGGNFLVVWTDIYPWSPVIKGVRVRASDGALLDTPQQIGGFFSVAPDETPTVASDGTNFLVAWSGWVADNGPPQWGVQLTRLNAANGQRVPGSNLFLAPGGGRPRATYGNGRFLVAWHVSDQGYNAYGAWIDAATGTPVGNSPFSLASSVADEKLVGVASSGGQFLVALRVGYSRVRALRITPHETGWLLDSPSLVVAESSATPPGVAFDGENYWVAWQGPIDGERQVYSMRVSTQGQLGVGEEYNLSSVASNSLTDAPSIASVGPGRFLVAWSQNEGGVNRVRIRLVNEVP